MRRIVSVGVVGGAMMAVCAACAASPPAVRVTLADASFGTSGGNLFNCTTPDRPANAHSVTPTTLGCEPDRNPDGTFTTQPVTVSQQVGCGDGHGALVTITCAGTGNGQAVSGTVSIALTGSCNDATTAVDVQAFAFQNVAPGQTQSSPADLQSCSVFGNLCGSSNDCAFNSFASGVTVENTTITTR